MIRLIVTDRDRVRSTEIAAHLLREIYVRHPRQFRWQAGAGIEELTGSRALRAAVEKGGIDSLLKRWRNESTRFIDDAQSALLY